MKIRILTAAGAAAIMVAGLSACAPGDTGDGSLEGTTITYWATNQAASIEEDERVLRPELDKFEEQTGIRVELEVVPWADLINNQLAAAVSGQGPDVSNLGNTNATTLATTGAWFEFDDEALERIGGADRFVPSAFATAGPEGATPTSLPLYSQVYGLYYNKQMFADAGLEPPATWEEFIEAAQALTDPGADQWGLTMPAGTVNTSMHMTFILTSQLGGSPFDAEGNPEFTTDEMIQGVKRYVDLMGEYAVLNPSTAQYTDGGGPSATDFASGKAAMYFAQTGGTSSLTANGMDPDEYGVVPIPAPEGGDPTGSSFVAGTNISIFKNTQNLDAALEFVKFMTSDEEQEILNKAYGNLPVVTGVPASAFEEYPDKLEAWSTILADHARPLPLVPTVSAFQANVGGAVVALMAQAATGDAPTEDDIRAALEEAQQKMAATS